MSTHITFEPCGCVLSLEDGEIQAVCDDHDPLTSQRAQLAQDMKRLAMGNAMI